MRFLVSCSLQWLVEVEHFYSPLGQTRQKFNAKDQKRQNEKRQIEKKLSDYRITKISVAVRN